ncbi:hypothetical protein WMW72_29920 [Paenibacillus filicis]|uniref:Uncharacterized protein n=1 Tax=Paenibacillus filicis TaxID=669464 RepID=A0ABU9DVI0_9BACL
MVVAVRGITAYVRVQPRAAIVQLVGGETPGKCYGRWAAIHDRAGLSGIR